MLVPSVTRDGYAIVAEGLSPADTERMSTEVAPLVEGVADHRGGSRNVFRDAPAVRSFVGHGHLYHVAASVLGPDCFPVRALLFDKTPGANWKVAWHQDVTIAVTGRREVPGFGPWTIKDGVAHVQPPSSVLERMLAVRLHLDHCGLENGPVRVLPGSHREGRLGPEQIQAWRRKQPEVVCVVPRGGLLLMRPLLLHASSPATAPAHRRVLHIEYAAIALPGGLQWHEAATNSVSAA